LAITHFLTLGNIFAAIAILNLWTFMLFGLDKIRAESGAWRVAESSLLLLAFVGGSIGAYLGRAVFRHKTCKQPFTSQLHKIAIFQGLVISGGAGWLFA
jgi:uncharacterized membrane protein YsdA (DUF1294 family)